MAYAEKEVSLEPVLREKKESPKDPTLSDAMSAAPGTHLSFSFGAAGTRLTGWALDFDHARKTLRFQLEHEAIGGKRIVLISYRNGSAQLD